MTARPQNCPRLAQRLQLLLHNPARRAAFSTRSPLLRSPAPANEAARKTSRLERTISKLPHFLRSRLQPLRAAPLTHVSAFLLLHEITAIVPLVGFAATFHYANWLPPYISEGAWVAQGVEKFGRYFRRKGWIAEAEQRGSGKAWAWGEDAVRILVEVGTAWAITKALLPARLLLSLWATPWFARSCVSPLSNAVKRLFGRTPKAPSKAPATASTAGGTGATAGGAVPKKHA